MGEELLFSSKTLYLAGTRKLRAKFVGPFRMIERIGKTAYRLDIRERFKDIHNVFHISQLGKHIPGGSSANPPKPIQVKSEEHFEVEALLQYKSKSNSW